jgi:hypothetical protein
MYSGAWHNVYPGDERIKLDYSKVISFYDTSIASSLVPQRSAKTNGRLGYRLEGISSDDIARFRQRLESVLNLDSAQAASSGVDWKTLLHVVTDRYADRRESI